MDDFVLTMDNITKSFSGNEVLHAAAFNLKAGEVHALMGENGSGKSTLMKILMGIYHGEKGIIRLFGEELVFSSPAQALEHGIAMIHQELSPVLDMEISENIFIGREIRDWSGLLVNIREMRRRAAEHLAQFGLDMDPMTKMRSLSVGQRQLIEWALKTHRLWRWSCTDGYAIRKARRLNDEDSKGQLHAETQRKQISA
ncbi:MAG: ATP-binding cassette domain-containing protein [Treponema sp.]|jgi:ABC-type sugar transport system ATPase subunit|nr:ATP-binding cassette domain-containing protein [Treponema sp.]